MTKEYEYITIVLERDQVLWLVTLLMAATRASMDMPSEIGNRSIEIGNRSIEIAAELNTALMQFDIAKETTDDK